MVVVNILIVIICSMGITTSQEALEIPSLAKPGCQARCGNISIPFPFGIGTHCAVDKWFQIQCTTSGPSPRLYLIHSNLEVLNFTDPLYENAFRVRNPISFYNSAGKEHQPPLNLTGKPFYLTSRYNSFVALSCGVIAKIRSSMTVNNDSRSIGYKSEQWCLSICSASNASNSLFNGINFCEISSFDSDNTMALTYEISFENTSRSMSGGLDSNDECKYAFFVADNYWYDYKNRSTNLTAITDQGSVC